MSRVGVTVGSLLVTLVVGGCSDAEPTVARRDLEIIKRAKKTSTSDGIRTAACAKKKTFYRDADGDGYGNGSKSVKACAPPPGFVDNAGDCYDGNRRARPGQRDYYAVHRGDSSFDYDCDGRQTRRFTARAFCRLKDSGQGCVHASGWHKGKIPKCGEPAPFTWKSCREQVVVRPPPGGADAGVPETQSAGALVPGAKQRKVYQCRGGKLPWKKRQLCR